MTVKLKKHWIYGKQQNAKLKQLEVKLKMLRKVLKKKKNDDTGLDIKAIQEKVKDINSNVKLAGTVSDKTRLR